MKSKTMNSSETVNGTPLLATSILDQCWHYLALKILVYFCGVARVESVLEAATAPICWALSATPHAAPTETSNHD